MSDLPVVVMDPKIKSIRDLKSSDKIVVPSLDSTQVLILRKALQNAGLDPHSLDTTLMTLGHPDSVPVLINRQVTAHISAPPYYQEEVKRGAHIILHTADVFPNGLSGALVVAHSGFAQQYPQFVAAFFQDYLDAVEFVKAHPDAAAKLYVDSTGGHADLAMTTEILRSSAAKLFAIAPKAVLESASLMKRFGGLEKVPASMAEIAVPVASQALASGD
ncbi:MAG: sulfonate transport system substrate-binding protein [Candidatus Eremiobacteraeota bacterium]|jgi:NitT/TauT family transport system substrate-binding protein|nr:sulfonate transport system substrate-binding protein [Candidatus Eremiobacteraeota bacterium]